MHWFATTMNNRWELTCFHQWMERTHRMDIGEYICSALYLGPRHSSIITLVEVVPEMVLAQHAAQTEQSNVMYINHTRSTSKSHFFVLL